MPAKLTGTAALLSVLLASTAIAAPDCMTLAEARKQHPTSHLYKSKGCWGLTKTRPHKVKPAPLPDIVPRVAKVNAEVVIDASGGDTFDTFSSFRERFITYALVDESKKADRLILPREAFDPPVITEQERVPLPPKKPTQSKILVETLWVLNGALFAIIISIFAIYYRPPSPLPLGRRLLKWSRRKTNDTITAIVARTNRQSAAERKPAIAGSTGAGDQQPHIHPWDIHDRTRRTNVRGHADHPRPPDDRRDDTGALGAWARSRGLRPKAP